MKESKKDGRRKFLDKGLKLGALTALGGLGISKIASGLNRGSSEDDHEKMELMTTNGDLIMVDTTEVEEVHHPADHDPSLVSALGFHPKDHGSTSASR